MHLTITAHPNSRKPRIEEDLFGTLHIYVAEPPLEGKANRAIADALAKYLNVRRSWVLLVSGERAKQKTFIVQEHT